MTLPPAMPEQIRKRERNKFRYNAKQNIKKLT